MKTSTNDIKQAAKVGCYSSISKSKYHSEDVQLPLKYFSYEVQLVQFLAYIKLQQVYLNHTSHLLDVQYVFPINPKAVIDSFQISFGGQTVKGIIKSREEAEKQFKDNQEEIKKVCFGGFDSPQSRNILKVKIGNISPGQEVKIRIAYIHPVLLVLNTFYQFRLPTTITPRYVSKLDSKKLVYSQNSDFDKKIDGICFWSIRIKIKSKKILSHVFSNTHSVKPSPKLVSKDLWQVILDEQNLTPTKDLSLCYSFDDFQKPNILFSEIDNQSQAIVSFVPNFCKLQINDAKRKAMVKEQQPLRMSLIKGEYIFILDRSYSMADSRIKKAKQSLIIFLKSLPQQSYFNIISFGDKHESLYPKSQNYQQNILTETIDKVKIMKADFGGTQILPPLKQSLQAPPIEEYPRHIFLLTDGAVFNTTSIIAFAAQHTQKSRVHTIGIGDGCSEDLIFGCAEMGKGHSVFITDQQDPSGKIIQLLDKSLSPVILDIKLQYDKSKVCSITPNPQKCPYILKNEIAYFCITFKGKLKDSLPIILSYTDSYGQKYSKQVQINPQSDLFCSKIQKMIHSINLNALYSAYKYEQPLHDYLYYAKQLKNQQLKKHIIEMSVQYQVLTTLTSFICVDESVPDQILKSKQIEDKQRVNILPINPANFKKCFPVQLGGYHQEYSQNDDGTLFYNQCAINSFHQNPKQIKLKEIPIPLRNLQPMVVLCKGQQITHNSKVNSGKGKKLCIDLIAAQGVDGCWKNFQDLKSIQSQQGLGSIKIIFNQKVSEDILCTFMIMKYIERFSDSKKVLLILRKARQYIELHSKSFKYSQLNAIWQNKIMKL